MKWFCKSVVLIVCLSACVGGAFGVSGDELVKITSAAPGKASVSPKRARKVLVFTRSMFEIDGRREQVPGHGSVPYCTKAMEVLGSKTGAYASDKSDEMSVFTAQNLKQYDAIIFNNTTRLRFDKDQRKALMDFVEGGKGIVGIHAATDNFYQWPEAAGMMGGIFDGHPWNANGTWAVRIEDAKNPVTAGFEGKDFQISDEIYRIKQIDLRQNARVLIGLDMTAEVNLKTGGVKQTDVDVPISWIRDFGKGRVFYCSLGHNNEIFWNGPILKHYLDGIQFAMGDLEADTTPLPYKKQFNDIKPFLDATAGFTYGQSRKALIAVENAIFEAADYPERLSEIAKAMGAFLGTDATSESKQFVCTQLGLISTGEGVEVLGQMLASEETSDMARCALERIPGMAADNALMEGFAMSESKTRIGIVNSLGIRRSAGAAQEIGPLALSSDKLLAGASIEALGRIATADAADALEAALKKNDPSHKVVIEDALLDCGDSLFAAGDRKNAYSAYKKLNSGTDNSVIKVASFVGMVKTSGSKAAGLIVDAVKSHEAAVRSQAISMVDEIRSKRGLKEVFETIEKLDPADKVQLLYKAGEIDSSVTIGAVLKYAHSSDENVRIAAISSMKSIGKADAVDVLASIAAETTGAVKQAAINSLHGLKGSGVDKEIVKLIGKSTSNQTKTILVIAAGKRSIADSVDVLAKQTASSDRNLSRQAYKSIALVAGGDDLVKMVELLVGLKNESNRSEAERTIASIVRSNSLGVKPIASALDRADDSKTKASLISVLGGTGSPEALSALLEGLGDSDEDVKVAAIRGLSQWPDGLAASELMAVAISSQNELHKALALRAAVRSIPLRSSRSMDENLKLLKQAVALASSPAEKRLVLSSLSSMPNTETLELAVSYFQDPAIKNDATTAITQMSPTLDGLSCDKIIAILENAKGSLADEDSKLKIQGVINLQRQFEGFVKKWQVSGPYTEGNLFDEAFAPEEPVNATESTVGWKTVFVDGRGAVDLGSVIGGDDRVAYLKANVQSDQARDLRFEMGSDDGIKVWVNGKIVHSNNVARGFVVNQDKAVVSLKKGNNVVLMKIIELTGDWGASLRIRNTDGTKAVGLNSN